MATINAFDSLRSFIDAGWGDAAPVSCPLAWDNEPFDEPQPRGPATGPDGKLVPNHWARVIISGDLWEQASIGTGEPTEERWDESGDITVIAFAPVNTGSRTVRTILTAFAEMCRGQDAGGIEFQDIRFDPIGTKDESGAWWGMHIVIEWIRRG